MSGAHKSCMQKGVEHYSTYYFVQGGLKFFAPLIVIIIPAADRKILHSRARMGLPHRLLS